MANGRGCRPHVCRECGGIDDDVGPISFRHKCEACAIRIQTQAVTEMHEGVGEYADRWRARMIDALWPRLHVNPKTGKVRERRSA